MSKSLQEIYRGKIFSLAKTIVFKCHYSAVATNRWLEELGYIVDWENLSTWKYYLNLSGEYHQFDHDYLVDTGGYIPVQIAGNNGPISTQFTNELVTGSNADTGTAAEYAYGSKSYKLLVAKYKLLEPLIMGILYSVDLKIAVTAPDWTILHIGGYYASEFPKANNLYVYHSRENDLIETLIEEQEVNIIPEMQKYITNVMTRWITPEYTAVDNLYLATCIGNLAAVIPTKIANLRLANCRTNMAHTFHIGQFLESHGYLGKHVPYLGLKESLWLYRNVDWLYHNFGKADTFNTIVDNILTPSNVPLSGYRLIHDNSDMDKETLYSTPNMVMDVINFKQSGTGTDTYSVRNILDKEAALARENTYNIDNVETTVSKASNRGRFQDLSTKVLESIMIDYSDYSPYSLSDMLLNHWIYHSQNGNYKGTIYITNPYTSERIQLSPLNAFILMTYCYYKGALGIEVDKVPTLHLRMIPKTQGGWVPSSKHLPFPTLEDLKYGTDKRYISESQLKDLYNPHNFNFNIRSADSFYGEVKKVHGITLDRFYKVCNVDDMYGRAMAQAAMRHYYWDDVVVKLSNTNESYTSWLSKMSIDLSNLSNEELVEMGDQLLILSTGIQTSTENQLRNLQKSCIDVLKFFSSYTVQFLDSTLISSPAMGDVKTIRIGEYKIIGYSNIKAEVAKVDVVVKTKTSFKFVLPLHKTDIEPSRVINIKKVVNLKLNLGHLSMRDDYNIKRTAMNVKMRIPISGMGMKVTIVEPK